MFRRLRRAQPSLRASFPHIHPRILASLATFLASDTSFLGLRATLRLRLRLRQPTTATMSNTCQHEKAHVSMWLRRLGRGGGTRPHLYSSRRSAWAMHVVGKLDNDCGSTAHRALAGLCDYLSIPHAPSDSIPYCPSVL